jgi:hypothetical protein
MTVAPLTDTVQDIVAQAEAAPGHAQALQARAEFVAQQLEQASRTAFLARRELAGLASLARGSRWFELSAFATTALERAPETAPLNDRLVSP